jgi:hypothetical protein
MERGLARIIPESGSPSRKLRDIGKIQKNHQPKVKYNSLELNAALNSKVKVQQSHYRP